MAVFQTNLKINSNYVDDNNENNVLEKHFNILKSWNFNNYMRKITSQSPEKKAAEKLCFLWYFFIKKPSTEWFNVWCLNTQWKMLEIYDAKWKCQFNHIIAVWFYGFIRTIRVELMTSKHTGIFILGTYIFISFKIQITCVSRNYCTIKVFSNIY